MSSLNNDRLILQLGDVTELVSTRNILSVENNCTGGVEIKYAITKGLEWMIEERTVASTSFQQDIVDVFKRIKETQTWRPKRLKVFINPSSGASSGRNLYFDELEPIFKMASIDTDAIVTTSGSEARETLMSADLTEIDGIISVGGDGTFWTVASGLLDRTQLDEKIDMDRQDQLPAEPKIRLGVIPGGSYCLTALDAVGIHSPITSAIQIALGYSHRRDAMSITNVGENKFIGFFTLTISFMIGHVTPRSISERLRPIFGPARIMIRQIIQNILNLNKNTTIKYHARITAEDTPKGGCVRNCGHCQMDKNSRSNSNDEAITRNDISTAVILYKGRMINPTAPRGLFPCAHMADGTAELCCYPVTPVWKIILGIFLVIVFNQEKVFFAKSIGYTSYRRGGVCKIELDFSESDVIPDIFMDDEKPYRLSNPQVKRVKISVHRCLLTMFGVGIDETASPWEGSLHALDVPYIRKIFLSLLLTGLLFMFYSLVI